MADLTVTPSYQLSERDILTVDKLNLMATPVVQLSIEQPINDQNFFRNGNFYSAFWNTPAGVSCPIGALTENAHFFFCTPQGGTVNYLRDTVVPDEFSLWSAELIGGPAVTTVEFGAQIVGDLAATLRRSCTFSGYIKNDTGLPLSPKLNIYTCNAFNNFASVTLVDTVDLQTVQVGLWGYETVTVDLSTLTNVANGLYITVLLPSGSLSATTKIVHFSRMKWQIGELATEFADDATLFDQTPSISASQLQDGCIARPTLFLPQVIPPGTYEPDSIQEGDIAAGAVDNDTLATGSVDSRVILDGSITTADLALATMLFIVPAGTILPFAGPNLPSGFLWCVGQAVLQSDYPNLFTAIGRYWGPGNGTTTFNLPDLRGYTLMGAGQGPGLSNRALAGKYGEENHQLNVNEMPYHGHTATVNEQPHNHGFVDNGHTHQIPYKANCQLIESGGSTNVCDPGGPLRFNSGTSGSGIAQINPNTTNLTVGISPNGSSGYHNNMQPTAGVNWMIRAA